MSTVEVNGWSIKTRDKRDLRKSPPVSVYQSPYPSRPDLRSENPNHPVLPTSTNKSKIVPPSSPSLTNSTPFVSKSHQFNDHLRQPIILTFRRSKGQMSTRWTRVLSGDILRDQGLDPDQSLEVSHRNQGPGVSESPTGSFSPSEWTKTRRGSDRVYLRC